MASRPSSVRYAVISATGLMSVLLYLDRFCISFAEIYIKEALALTDSQIGCVLGSFFLAYALGQVPAGWLTDRFGARIMLTIYIVGWSLLTGLTGASFAFVSLIMFRTGFGLAQAGAYPTGAHIVSKWIPYQGRGRASSIVSFGGRVGGALAPLVTGYLIVVLVPNSVSSMLTTQDLLDPPRLAYEILDGTDPNERASRLPGKRIQQLSPGIRQVAGQLAEFYVPAGSAAVATRSGPPGNDEIGRFVVLLNEIIARPDVYDAVTFREVGVEKEAKRLLVTRRDRSLSANETSRLNRLLLEGAFRNSIRKVYGSGWRSVLVIYATIGGIVAALFWCVFRNSPGLHPWCNESEVALIEQSRPKHASLPHGTVRAAPMHWIVRSRSMWLSSGSQFFTNIGWVLLMTWAPRYFQSAHQVDLETRAWMVFIPACIGWLGMLSGGFLTDSLTRRIGVRWGRALPMSLSRFVAMFAYLGCLYPWSSPWVVVGLFSLVAFSTDIGTAAGWAFTQDVGGCHVGSILGWGNMWGNIGAALATSYLIRLVGVGDNWNFVFVTCAGAFLVSGIAAAGIDARVPVVSDEQES